MGFRDGFFFAYGTPLYLEKGPRRDYGTKDKKVSKSSKLSSYQVWYGFEMDHT